MEIRIYANFLTHRKIRTLRRQLGADSVLCLIALWLWVAENQPEGELEEDVDGFEIEELAGWAGEEGKFFDALTEIGLIEKGANGLRLHDWADWQPYVIGAKERKRKAARAAAARWAKGRVETNA